MDKAYDFHLNTTDMLRNITGSAYAHVAASKVKSLVIGMSGGIDSTITAALAKRTLDRLNVRTPKKDRIKLIGRVINIKSKRSEMERAKEACKVFCDSHGYINLDDTYEVMIEDMDLDKAYSKEKERSIRIRRGNVKARLRMIQLYDIAKEHNGMVLSTDNYTEYLLGFWTLHGDVGDFGMIQNLWKSEVYWLAEHMVREYNYEGNFKEADVMQKAIKALPTDGLGITNSDFDQIHPEASKNRSPAQNYHEVDCILYNYLKLRIYGYHDVVKMYERTKFKRKCPFNIPRKYITK